jgi:hypothetical protein
MTLPGRGSVDDVPPVVELIFFVVERLRFIGVDLPEGLARDGAGVGGGGGGGRRKEQS